MYLMVNRVQDLLQALEAFVTDDGAILSVEDVTPLVESMDNITSVESKCTFINLVLNTKNPAILERLVSSGGWRILNEWLSHVLSASESDSLLVEELLHVLLKLPVTVELLKSSKSPMMVKNLSKNSSYSSEVVSLACQIVKAWTDVITAESKPSKKVPTDVAKKSKSKTENESSESVKLKKPHAPPSSGARKTGLEEENTLKPPTKKRPSLEMDKSATEQKKPKVESGSSPKTEIKESASTQSNPKIPEKFPQELSMDKTSATVKQNVEPPKPKPVVITQSSLFADALFKPVAPVAKPKVKPKIKKTHVNNENKLKDLKEALSSSPSKEVKEKLPEVVKTEAEQLPLQAVKAEDVDAVSSQTEPEKKPDVEEIKPDNCWDPALGPKPILIYHRSRKKTNRVKFRDEENLVQVELFEVEEGERTNFRKQQDAADIHQDYAKIEMMREKMTMLRHREGIQEDAMNQEGTAWKLQLFEFPDNFDQSLPPRGALSTERELQNKREIGVLAELHFDKSKIPYSPKEPDREQVELTEPIIIPLGDIKVSSSDTDVEGKPAPLSPTTLATIQLQNVPRPLAKEVAAVTAASSSTPSAKELVTLFDQDTDMRMMPPPTTMNNVEPRQLPSSVNAPNVPRNIIAQNPANPRNPNQNAPGLLHPGFQMRPGAVMPGQGFSPGFPRLNQFDGPPTRMMHPRGLHLPHNFGPRSALSRFGTFDANRPPRLRMPMMRPPPPMNSNQRMSAPPQRFPQNMQPQSARPSLDASQVCLFHAQGHCKHGDKCKLVHVPRGPPPAPENEDKKDIDLRDFFGSS